MSTVLDGGRENIYKEKNVVHRPTHKWTKHVHDYLKYLHSNGFDKAPFPYAEDANGIEKVSYIEGEVYNGILPLEAQSDELLVSFSKLVREYHDIGETYINQLTGEENWMLSTKSEVETMCHGDLGPYNIAVNGNDITGFIDFDTLHPGSRSWDLAYSAYRWVPLMSPENAESFGTESDKQRRLKLLIDTYGYAGLGAEQILTDVIKRLEYLIDFMRAEASGGDETFKKHIEQGHLDLYYRDIEYIKSNWKSV